MTLNLRDTRSMILAAAALCYLTASQSLVAADPSASPNVIYTANGVFAATPISGPDNVRLAGQPFTIQIEANESLAPTSSGPGWAEYTGLTMQATIRTPFNPAPLTFKNRRAAILLAVGDPDHDVLDLSSTVSLPGLAVGGLWLKFRAEALIPKGTLTSDMVLPLTAPYTVSAGNPATFMLACAFAQPTSSVCDSSPLLSSTLGIASGTLTTTVQ